MADRPILHTRTDRRRNALVAASQVVTSRSVRRKPSKSPELASWQAEAWEHYDHVGELRFGISWISNAWTRVNLVAASAPMQPGDDPVALGPGGQGVEMTRVQARAVELVEQIAGGPTGQGQVLGQFGKLLPLQGWAWLIAEPDADDPEGSEGYATWTVYAQDQVQVKRIGGEDRYQVQGMPEPGSSDNWRTIHEFSLVVKSWKPHAHQQWQPDSQVRGVLTVLELIDLFTRHLIATGRSRLAGAGILAIPSETTFAESGGPFDDSRDSDGDGEADEVDPFDAFVDNLTDMMTTPIRDRDNASAVVPLVVQVPGEYVDKLKHITFSTPFDERVSELLTQQIQRLALGLDIPPEVLTGMSDVNHWTAWQVEDTAITLHIEPGVEVVCDAVTDGYLRDALSAEGFSDEEVASVLVWYDTTALTAPPDLSQNVVLAFDRLEASGSALRTYLGLAEADKPTEDELVIRLMLKLADANPAAAANLLSAVGLWPDEAAPIEAADPSPVEGEPDDADADEVAPDGPPDGDSMAASMDALIAASDGICFRAMERAGGRLKNALGRKVGGAATAASDVSPALLHTAYDATLYADLDHLLSGAFDRCDELADDLHIDSDAWRAALNGYLRGLLAAGNPHERFRLVQALGADALV